MSINWRSLSSRLAELSDPGRRGSDELGGDGWRKKGKPGRSVKLDVIDGCEDLADGRAGGRHAARFDLTNLAFSWKDAEKRRRGFTAGDAEKRRRGFTAED